MKIIAFLVFIGSFSLFIYMNFISDDTRDGNRLQKITNDPEEMRKLEQETIEYKKELKEVFEADKIEVGKKDEL